MKVSKEDKASASLIKSYQGLKWVSLQEPELPVEPELEPEQERRQTGKVILPLVGGVMG